MLWHGGPQELDVSLVVVEAAREGNALSAMRMALPSMGLYTPVLYHDLI